ncbi:hypothetical protein MP638_001026 [Amoeboaphelidium occidentale]|nr:hypothetical protein MP638_001026 [Amoeboaphelidium occidentale]
MSSFALNFALIITALTFAIQSRPYAHGSGYPHRLNRPPGSVGLASHYLLHAEDFMRKVVQDQDPTMDGVADPVEMHLQELKHGVVPEKEVVNMIKKDIEQELKEADVVHDDPLIAQKIESIKNDIVDFSSEDEDLDMLYYWFSLHDEDNNGYLDGSELLHAFSHWNEEFTPEDEQVRQNVGHHSRRKLLIAMEDMVDHVLKEDDIDNDGFISVEEFMQSGHY